MFWSAEGYDVQCADNAQQAISLAQAQHFDLVLIDNWNFAGAYLVEVFSL